MVRLFISVLLFHSFAFSATVYQACGTEKEHARANLAQQISSDIRSHFSSNQNVSEGFFTKNSKEVAYTIESSSSLTLTDITYTQTKDEVCASISKETLIGVAKGKIKTVKEIKLANLPQDELKTINLLEGYLNDTNQAMAIAALHADAFEDADFRLLHEMKKKLLDTRAKYHAQKISFDITPIHATLFINGEAQNRHHNISLKPGTHSLRLSAPNYEDYLQEFTLAPNQVRTMTLDISGNRHPQVYFALSNPATIEIHNKTIDANSFEYVAPGEHRYKVSMQGYCPAIGDMKLTLGQTRTIHINNSALTYPTITVQSNQPKATLKIDGKSFDLGAPKTYHACEPTLVSYAVTFEDQTQTQSTTLTPGEQKEVNVNFLTRSDREKLLAQARSFRNKGRYTLYAGNAFFEDAAFMLYGLESLNHKNWLRYGYGGTYGKNANDTTGTLYYNVAFQLTQVGSQMIPLHLNGFALIPYIGTQAGVWYHSFGQETYGLTAKALLGVSFVFNEDVAFEFNVGKNFVYDQEWTVHYGVSLRDPF